MVYGFYLYLRLRFLKQRKLGCGLRLFDRWEFSDRDCPLIPTAVVITQALFFCGLWSWREQAKRTASNKMTAVTTKIAARDYAKQYSHAY
jgi:hypothetical protein